MSANATRQGFRARMTSAAALAKPSTMMERGTKTASDNVQAAT